MNFEEETGGDVANTFGEGWTGQREREALTKRYTGQVIPQSNSAIWDLENSVHNALVISRLFLDLFFSARMECAQAAVAATLAKAEEIRKRIA